MTFFRASRVPVLAGLLLLIGFAGASYGAVRFDVVPSPTEVINTGRSEVTGSVNMIVRGTGNLTGTSTGGNVQIGLIYTNPAMQIDNDEETGIRLFWSTGFNAANPTFLTTDAISNRMLNGRCTGFITINLEPGATPAEGDWLRIEGVRGRIDASLAITPGTDLFVDMQSINDPTANSFTPDRVRVAKSLDGMEIEVTADSLLLCFPTLGKFAAGPEYMIEITEGFARAFVDDDANNDGININDRVDTGSHALGAPTNSTEFFIWMEGIPTSVAEIHWPETVYSNGGNSTLELDEAEDISSAGVAWAYYIYETEDQTNWSDQRFETFEVQPIIELDDTDATATGNVYVAVSLAPGVDEADGCDDPYGLDDGDPEVDQPRFLEMLESEDIATNNPPDDAPALYASIIRCNCFMLFTYVSYTGPTMNDFNTGIAIANTTGDEAVFDDNEAPDQLGNITFYFYDAGKGYVGSSTTSNEVTAGKSFIALLNQILPSGVTTFQGYIIAKAEFQFCHALAYIADNGFAKVAHGYLANIIPDPAIWGGRLAVDASALSWHVSVGSEYAVRYMVPAGESLNN